MEPKPNISGDVMALAVLMVAPEIMLAVTNPGSVKDSLISACQMVIPQLQQMDPTQLAEFLSTVRVTLSAYSEAELQTPQDYRCAAVAIIHSVKEH